MHHVYTLGNTLAIGGHFLMEEMMHLTEWCRMVAHVIEQQGTNAVHPGMMRALSRMVMALAVRSPIIGK